MACIALRHIITLSRLLPDPEIGIDDSNKVGATNHALQVFYV
jgi:hypothetical protein